MWCTNRLLWHTNSDFYGVRTPPFMPYEPFLLGVGVVYNLLKEFRSTWLLDHRFRSWTSVFQEDLPCKSLMCNTCSSIQMSWLHDHISTNANCRDQSWTQKCCDCHENITQFILRNSDQTAISRIRSERKQMCWRHVYTSATKAIGARPKI